MHKSTRVLIAIGVLTIIAAIAVVGVTFYRTEHAKAKAEIADSMYAAITAYNTHIDTLDSGSLKITKTTTGKREASEYVGYLNLATGSFEGTRNITDIHADGTTSVRTREVVCKTMNAPTTLDFLKWEKTGCYTRGTDSNDPSNITGSWTADDTVNTGEAAEGSVFGALAGSIAQTGYPVELADHEEWSRTGDTWTKTVTIKGASTTTVTTIDGDRLTITETHTYSDGQAAPTSSTYTREVVPDERPYNPPAITAP